MATNKNPYQKSRDTVVRSVSFDPHHFRDLKDVGERPRYAVDRSGMVRIALDLLFSELGEPGYVRPSLDELRLKPKKKA